MTRHTFEVTDSKLLVDSPIIALRRDQVTMPGGGVASREIVEHFGAVAVVALDDDNRIAMVEQYRHSVGKRLWELPAGILDIANEDPTECARRELHEEAGLEATEWTLLTDIVTSPGFCEETVRIFLARGLSQVERPEAQDEEADMEFQWVPLDEARSAVMDGRINNAIALAGIMTAAEVVEGRATSRPVEAPFELRPESMAQRRQAQGVVPDMKKVQ
ncbi:NUDIX hydrolase [Corynebacterium breve]|uniref:NUDIX hydrolase n=1 Tax=Corynebacterium breve TaxID=3049799 RepID=A0ABY8VGK7_9CORY|nr:NUDIX hydrolase [Corynebacterium breve]WIM68784.1 NUDIX hydrolase [Corynebacterium breve]